MKICKECGEEYVNKYFAEKPYCDRCWSKINLDIALGIRKPDKKGDELNHAKTKGL